MNVGNMGGDFYLNFFLLALIEFPAYSICIYLVDKIGRKKLHCGCMLLGGFACASTIFTVSFGGKCKCLGYLFIACEDLRKYNRYILSTCM